MPTWLDWLAVLLPLLSLAPEPAGDIRDDGVEKELSVSPAAALVMQKFVSRVISLSLNRRRIGSLQSWNESSDAVLVAVFGGLLGLGEITDGGDVGDDGSGSSSRFHRSDGSQMDA